MEVLGVIVELWERCDNDREIRAIGVFLEKFRKTKVSSCPWGRL